MLYDWYNCWINYTREPTKKPWKVLKAKLWAFLKPRIIVNQTVSKLCMDVKRNQIKIQKQTEKENIIKNIKNPFKLKKRKSIKDRTIRDNIKILLKNKMIIINHKE